MGCICCHEEQVVPCSSFSLTCVIPAMWEEKESLKITSPVRLFRTSTFPPDHPVMTSGIPSPFMSKLWRHIGWFLDCVCVCVCVSVCVCECEYMWVCVCVSVRVHLQVTSQCPPHMHLTSFMCSAPSMYIIVNTNQKTRGGWNVLFSNLFKMTQKQKFCCRKCYCIWVQETIGQGYTCTSIPHLLYCPMQAPISMLVSTLQFW